jgi:formylglycine-generating enzyme required for sulfatase activity
VKLADAWWDAAAERRGEEKAALLRCAGHWYEQALGRLEGISKTKVEKRLAEIAELRQEPASRGGREPPPAIAPFDAKRARAYQLQWARYLKVPVEFTNSIGMKFVLIPPGEFDMGTSEQAVERLCKQAKQRVLREEWIGRVPSEAPQHRVKITRAFYLGLCEVTKTQYSQEMGSNPSQFKDAAPDAPVEQVSWDDAVAFCRRLSGLHADKIAPGDYRLPTEAEWEYAARAGTSTAYFFGDDATALSDYAWHGNNSGGRPHAVGQKRPNPFGLCDVLGNVWEWCADAFSADYYKQSPVADPPGPPAGAGRVVRGASCYPDSVDLFLRCAFRHYVPQDFRDFALGFRVARSLPAQATSPKETNRPASAGSARSSASASGFAPLTPDHEEAGSAGSASQRAKSRGEKSKVEPGTILAEDKHESWCGHSPKNDTYTLRTEVPVAMGRTYLRFQAGPIRESNGQISLNLDGDSFYPFAVWTTATCLESLRSGEGWQTVAFPPAVDKVRSKQIRVLFQFLSGPDGLTVSHVVWIKK